MTVYRVGTSELVPFSVRLDNTLLLTGLEVALTRTDDPDEEKVWQAATDIQNERKAFWLDMPAPGRWYVWIRVTAGSERAVKLAGFLTVK